tara:strand:+ start:1307 stop:1639 length:333 start_codon:yes stop_codon:yes gene_type:complete
MFLAYVRNSLVETGSSLHCSSNLPLADVVFLQQLTEENMGSAYSKWRIFEFIRQRMIPNDYVMVFDGDDVLHDNRVLEYIHSSIQEFKPWFLWGRIIRMFRFFNRGHSLG